MPPSGLTGTAWRRSDYSGPDRDDRVEVTVNPSGPMPASTPAAWRDSLKDIRNGNL
ncbi:hypothetical protein GCM10022252_04030 [Streptosporangium oxazolinicum]|uniref:DUF397 domain-containing protein n=1 Tax=Streptosporangium oxazolinicum TaxID=909287 RepID=A0ABP8AAB8_9ACTN